MGLFDFFKKDNSPTPEKLIKAAKKGNLELVNSLLENGVDVNSRDEKGWTPLIWASFNNYTALIKTLLKKGADVNAKDNEGRTALILAADNGWVETMKTLMEAGAQIDDKYKDEVLTLINGHKLPMPEAQPPFPEFARKHDLSLVVEVKKKKTELQISADSCTIDWGDDSGEDKYSNIKEKTISHRYPEAGIYTITINATGLSRFFYSFFDAKATAIYLNNCPQLEYLTCFLNELTSLDISRCTSLERFYCGNNKLTSLDLSNNLALNDLDCSNNLLTCLDISNNTQLTDVNCSLNQLSILNVNRDSKIAHLRCNDNQLSKFELNMIFNQLPRYRSSYVAIDTWYSGSTYTANVFVACGVNPGFASCNKKIVQNKKWLVWGKAIFTPATLSGTPSGWEEDFRN